MRVATINIDKNFEMLDEMMAAGSLLSEPQKKSVGECKEVIKILLERLERRRPGRRSSEKSKREKKDGKKGDGNRGVKREQLPSKRYPDAPVVEKEVKFEGAKKCPCCGEEMADSGMREVSESLEVIPKKYIIVRESRVKLRCRKCHGGMATAPAGRRVLPGSSYGDSIIIDVAVSKYAHLIPVERYAQMATAAGLEGLPPNSLIGLTHHLANFLMPVHKKIEAEVRGARVLHGDETTHRMLERGGGGQWYLWGFSSTTASFFAIRDTRAGAVASGFLKGCSAGVLVSDAYSGYGKALREVNKERRKRGEEELRGALCNAHARRNFTKMRGTPDYNDEKMKRFRGAVERIPKMYKKIYRLEKWGCKEGFDKAKFRKGMRKYFESMRKDCEGLGEEYTGHKTMKGAADYLLKYYEGLTMCVDDPEIPLDNNHQERELRRPVVGRKTWYGTHSKRGADTAAIHFSIVNSCRLNGVEPGEYLAFVVKESHEGREPPTPREYALIKRSEQSCNTS